MHHPTAIIGGGKEREVPQDLFKWRKKKARKIVVSFFSSVVLVLISTSVIFSFTM